MRVWKTDSPLVLVGVVTNRQPSNINFKHFGCAQARLRHAEGQNFQGRPFVDCCFCTCWLWLATFLNDVCGAVFLRKRSLNHGCSSMATKPKQYVETMAEADSYVQREWESSGWKLLGTRGFCAVQSVRKSHPALPIFMNALAGLVVASNGAMLRLWGATMPLALWVVNINYSQTRKSGLSAIAEVYASAADQRMRKMFREILGLKQSASCLNIVYKF